MTLTKEYSNWYWRWRTHVPQHTGYLYQHDKWHPLWRTKAASVINLWYCRVLELKTVSQPPPLDPVLDSVNLMMPPSDLRWTEGDVPFRTFVAPRCNLSGQALFQGHSGAVQWLTMHHPRMDTHTHTHTVAYAQTHTHTCSGDKQHIELNLTACQMWMKPGDFDWKRVFTADSWRTRIFFLI